MQGLGEQGCTFLLLHLPGGISSAQPLVAEGQLVPPLCMSCSRSLGLRGTFVTYPVLPLGGAQLELVKLLQPVPPAQPSPCPASDPQHIHTQEALAPAQPCPPALPDETGEKASVVPVATCVSRILTGAGAQQQLWEPWHILSGSLHPKLPPRAGTSPVAPQPGPSDSTVPLQVLVWGWLHIWSCWPEVGPGLWGQSVGSSALSSVPVSWAEPLTCLHCRERLLPAARARLGKCPGLLELASLLCIP